MPAPEGHSIRTDAALRESAGEGRLHEEVRYEDGEGHGDVLPRSDAIAYDAAVEEARERHLTENFTISLMRHIEERGMDPVTVYKRANIDRKLFSKIKNNAGYMPSKKTVLVLALALELSLDETQALLKQAGFTLSPNIVSDVIIELFISHGRYDISEINAALFACGQPIL